MSATSSRSAIPRELGDARRFRSSDEAIGTAASRSPSGNQTKSERKVDVFHQGRSLMRRALLRPPSAPLAATHRHAYYLEVAERIDTTRLRLGRAQTLPARTPHPARTGDEAFAQRPADSKARRRAVWGDHRELAHHHTDAFAASSRNAPEARAREAGRDPATERPQISPEQHPINHLVAGHAPRT